MRALNVLSSLLSAGCFSPTLRPALLRHASAPRLCAPDHVVAVDADGLDKLVYQEVEAAFADLQLDPDDDDALDIIRAQGAKVLANVYAALEADGQKLEAGLASQVEQLASRKAVELLRKYDARLGELQARMQSERLSLRSELSRLNELNDELSSLQRGGGLGRDQLVAGLSFLVGAAGLGAALNEGLKIAVGAGGEPAAAGLNAALALLGFGYYALRRGGASGASSGGPK